MPRRLIVILTLCIVVVAAGVALHHWAVTSVGPAQMLARQLSKDYGLDVDVHGRSTLTLLPRPRIKVEGVEIRGIDGRLSIRQATLRGYIGWFGLLRGRAELSDITLRDAAASLDMRGADERFWGQWAAWTQLRSSNSPLRQLTITNSSLAIQRDKHPQIAFDKINGILEWPGSTMPLSVSGNLRWNGETITLNAAKVQPTALLGGKSGPFSLDIAALDAHLTASGTVQMDRARNILLSGTSSFSGKAVHRLVEWADLPVPLSPVLDYVALNGTFTTTRNLISWPAVRITVGKDKFEGSLAFRFDNLGNMISGTLATDQLDLTGYLAPVAALADRNADLSYTGINRADLDLRLSATSGTLGSLKMADIALGLIVKKDRLEASLSRASIDNGKIKGRFLMTGPAAEKEIRLQGAADDIDIARLLPPPGNGNASLSGRMHSQITLEGRGGDIRSALQSSRGKIVLSVANGEIRGFDLPALLRPALDTARAVTPDAAHSSFTNANLVLTVESGLGQITEGGISSGNWQAAIQNGALSLPDRLLHGEIRLLGEKSPATLTISDLLSAPKFMLVPSEATTSPIEKQ